MKMRAHKKGRAFLLGHRAVRDTGQSGMSAGVKGSGEALLEKQRGTPPLLKKAAP
ncbi:hypothetical protein [Novacetimonas hansenii]|uniref:hypothetical protein n=1 Tax=Novacetimonas hansenii TaxID=436 RepID=UPI0015C013A1|nr:hypothetical protein [Novacetimonas hansenii]